MKESKLAVSEMFYSIQGEGQTVGKPAYFLRLAACNLMCGGAGTEKDGKLHNGATWRCDSIEVWRKGKKMFFNEIVEGLGGKEFINNLHFGVHLIITGGEPLLQQIQVSEFIEYLIGEVGHLFNIEIETNGTIIPISNLLRRVIYWNVSPKLSNSGESYERRIIPEALSELGSKGKRTIFKFVVSNSHDMDEILELRKLDYNNYEIFHRSQIWLMPAGSTIEELKETAPLVARYCKQLGFSYSHRVHIAIWDRMTGV